MQLKVFFFRFLTLWNASFALLYTQHTTHNTKDEKKTSASVSLQTAALRVREPLSLSIRYDFIHGLSEIKNKKLKSRLCGVVEKLVCCELKLNMQNIFHLIIFIVESRMKFVGKISITFSSPQICMYKKSNRELIFFHAWLLCFFFYFKHTKHNFVDDGKTLIALQLSLRRFKMYHLQFYIL